MMPRFPAARPLARDRLRRHGGDLASAGDLGRGRCACAPAAPRPMRRWRRSRRLCVVEPHMTGIGGDCYCLVSQPGKPVWGYNGSGRAGAKASDEALRAQGHATRSATRSTPSPCRARSMPGRRSSKRTAASASIARCNRRSNMPKADFRWPRASPGTGQRYVAKLKADPGASKHYLFNGAAPKEGDVIRFPALAQTLKTIAAKGARAFYEGEIAEDMAATVAARGSFLTADDFARASRRRGRRRSRPIIAGSIWSKFRRTGRASPRW